MADETFREWLARQIAACASRAVNDTTKKSREYHGHTRMLLQGILAEYDRRVASPAAPPEGDLPTEHPNRCRLRDHLLDSRERLSNGEYRPAWRCHKRADHDGPCSTHNDCGVIVGGVVCGKSPGHAGPHANVQVISVASPAAVAGDPALEWEGPDDEGDFIVRLIGVNGWHLIAHGKTHQIALARLGEMMLLAREDDAQARVAARAESCLSHGRDFDPVCPRCRYLIRASAASAGAVRERTKTEHEEDDTRGVTPG